MDKKAKDYGKITYSPSVVNTAQEHVTLSFLRNDINIKLTCHVLEQGFSDRHEAMHFIHPAPPFSRLFLFMAGGADLKIPNDRLKLTPGIIYLLPPNQPFDVTYDISRLLFFHLHICDNAGQSLFKNTTGVPAVDNPALFERFRQGFNTSNKLQTLSALLDTISILLDGKLDEIAENANKSKLFAQLFEYLENKPIARITISELADLYSISPDALSKRFCRTMGTSLKHYLLDRQFKQAKELLLHSNMTVTQIAEVLGHTNSQYFHRFFRKHCLCTPGEYRKKYHRDLTGRYIQRT